MTTTIAELADEFFDRLVQTQNCYAELRRRLDLACAEFGCAEPAEPPPKPEPEKALSRFPDLVDALAAAIERYQRRKPKPDDEQT